MMKKMRLLSLVFRTKKNLSKGEEKKEEEGPYTSYSQEGVKHEGHLDHQILSDYLVEYKSQPRAFQETLAFPQFIQLKEEKIPCNKREIKGNRFLLSTFEGSSTTRASVRKLEAFFLLHPVVEKKVVEISMLHLECEAHIWWFTI